MTVLRADALRAPATLSTPLVLLGGSTAVRRLDDDLRMAARASCVLVEGEAGLDLVEIAHVIHGLSRRAGTCVLLDGAVAEPAQVERELFGDHPQRPAGDVESIGTQSALARAHSGTLYLGDLAELSASVQARLARIVRDGEVRVGTGDARPLEVALVAMTAGDLEAEVGEGRLRRDLVRHFTRTRVAVPGLRQRAEDIPLMVEAIVAQICDRAGLGRKTFTQAAVTLLSAMPWHGNLEELRHAVARIVGDVPGDHIQLEDVLTHIRFDAAVAPHAPNGTLRSARRQFERDYIALVLRHHRGRVGDAARALGIQRTNLYRKARQLGISVARPVQQS